MVKNTHIERLGRYAHNNNPHCRLTKCPTTCRIHTLDLDTAIAWEIFELLHYPEDTKGKAHRLNSLVFVVALHARKYPELWKLLDPINDLIGYCWWYGKMTENKEVWHTSFPCPICQTEIIELRCPACGSLEIDNTTTFVYSKKHRTRITNVYECRKCRWVSYE